MLSEPSTPDASSLLLAYNRAMNTTDANTILHADLLRLAKVGDFGGASLIVSQNEIPAKICSQALEMAASEGHAPCVSLLAPLSFPHAIATCLLLAVKNARPECVKILAAASNAQSLYHALLSAASLGQVECVKLLILVAPLEPSGRWSPLLRAAASGHAECVKLLIPLFDPKADMSIVLRWAASSGHAECVKLLIPVSEPKVSDALRLAASRGHAECLKLLIPVSDPLIERDGILSQSLAAGHANTTAILLDCEPRLIEAVNLFESLSEAQASGHFELAELLSSIIDRQILTETVPEGCQGPSLSLGVRL